MATNAKTGNVVNVDLPAEIFDVQVNVPLIHQVVVAQQAAARQGTHDSKTRGEVRGGGRKPYKQKGTGRARQGSTRAPQFADGGTVHGPTPRSYDQRTPKKMKAAALRGALSDRARAGRVHVVESFVSGDKPSTKDALSALKSFTDRPRALVVLERGDDLMGGFRDLVKRARAGTLRSSELSDSTITVTSFGEQGVDAVFGIIYPPQVAIVGFGRVAERPWSVEGRILSRPVANASLSADHRVCDGHRAGLFLAALDRLLQAPEQL